jgi:guanylate cyclase
MASAVALGRLGIDDPARADSDAEVTRAVFGDVVSRRVIAAADGVLVAFCLLSLAVALRAYVNNETAGGAVVAIAALLVGNVVISVQPMRWRRPVRVEIVRAALGAIVAPVAYLTTTQPFGHWWPGFLLMCITSAVTVGVLTASPRSGRLIVTYYVALFAVSAFIAGDVTLARGLVVGGGIAIAGLVLGECVAGLGQKLAVERAQRAQIEQLMLRVFPESVAAALEQDRSVADEFDEASILFADIQGFTELSSRLTPAEIVTMLNEVFSVFDELVDEFGLEKIKTIGDCYMVAAGVPDPRPDHAAALCAFGLRLQELMQERTFQGRRLQFRVGINSGPVIAGIVGRKRFLYDLWGDAVNLASRMESHGTPGTVQITRATYERIADEFRCEPQGTAEIKGKGPMPVWHVLGPKTREIPGQDASPAAAPQSSAPATDSSY